MNMVEKLATAPVPKLASPCEFGPDDPHALGAGARGHRRLLALAVGVGFAEAGTHHDRQP